MEQLLTQLEELTSRNASLQSRFFVHQFCVDPAACSKQLPLAPSETTPSQIITENSHNKPDSTLSGGSISFISIESSIRRGDGAGEAPQYDISGSPFAEGPRFRRLVPDDSTLSRMSVSQLKNVVHDLQDQIASQTEELRCRERMLSNYRTPSLIAMTSESHNDLDAHGDTSADRSSTGRPFHEPCVSEAEGDSTNRLCGKLFQRDTDEAVSVDHSNKYHSEAQEYAEIEISRLRSELTASENVNALLKEQIKLNSRTDASSTGFNPEMIIEMAREIERLKKDVDRLQEARVAISRREDEATGTSLMSRMSIRSCADKQRSHILVPMRNARSQSVEPSAHPSKQLCYQSVADPVADPMMRSRSLGPVRDHRGAAPSQFGFIEQKAGSNNTNVCENLFCNRHVAIFSNTFTKFHFKLFFLYFEDIRLKVFSIILLIIHQNSPLDKNCTTGKLFCVTLLYKDFL